MSAGPTCQIHDEAVARHAIRIEGTTGLVQVCCQCATDSGRTCTH